MIFDLLAPPQGPRGRGLKKCAIAHPIHVSNSHTKFGWISSNGLGGDSLTDGRTDGGDCNIPNAFLKKRGDNEPIQENCITPRWLNSFTYKRLSVNVYNIFYKNVW